MAPELASMFPSQSAWTQPLVRKFLVAMVLGTIEVEFCSNCQFFDTCAEHGELDFFSIANEIKESDELENINVTRSRGARHGSFEINFRCARGLFLLHSKLRTGKMPSNKRLIHMVKSICADSQVKIALYLHTSDIKIGLELFSQPPYRVKCVRRGSVAHYYGVDVGDYVAAVGNVNHFKTVDHLLAAMRVRPLNIQFIRSFDGTTPLINAAFKNARSFMSDSLPEVTFELKKPRLVVASVHVNLAVEGYQSPRRLTITTTHHTSHSASPSPKRELTHATNESFVADSTLSSNRRELSHANHGLVIDDPTLISPKRELTHATHESFVADSTLSSNRRELSHANHGLVIDDPTLMSPKRELTHSSQDILPRVRTMTLSHCDSLHFSPHKTPVQMVRAKGEIDIET